ncbi:COQ9-domain-containing protein [Aspergillus novoparasiticus]|uniref:Ubiquinone biosynthesis protein n=1 Tax=Aspergillus novoparasiticus TaxID=986946 RepID=A0A5N6F6P8_9EURO|nr:COQ9-domain-containing protein [Aspergillus novoparasiticus]
MAQPHNLTRCHAALLSTSKRQLTTLRTTRSIIPQCTRQLHHQTRPARRHPTPAHLTSSPVSQPTRRSYHSEHHPDPPPHEYTNSQTTILSAALRHVPTHGFTRDALTLGARDSGFLDVSVQLLPRGEFDLVLFWLASRRGLLRASVDNGLFEKDERVKAGLKLTVEEKTKLLIMERLRMNIEIRHQWQDALALMSLAGNIPLSLSELHALSSEILTLAGDASVDASWYTKRLSVAAIYASSEVVMTRDQSPGLSETEAFVERRVEDSSAIGEKLTGFKQCLGFVGSTAIGLGRSWGLKI